ncbi:M55 family metallopeptidase [Paramaledivibacter caminithermalis]|uniref:D-amino peptidase n=1 Tax=Paramaledivibacter caminithermalis (strain DSM 15212 / CIP 107654 / DViRD3) TaxID=1121301 RepID=A0A1M6P847_PARC5|nr:M55 family metallopeptidase [Paramaledivibacter caminithermalis]SHK04070.1 D-amino peptidase [Paramaledivibacter caminithermalis DSM 15212]
MKIYISADIEGITGVTSWSETDKGHADYSDFVKQMEKEVCAACKGAIKAGAKEILIKDAHDSGRNINPAVLPRDVKLIRGWSGHPFSMVQELDESFDALMFIGYHSCGGSKHNPLSHTMNSSDVNYIKINGRYASEFLIHAYAAATVNVPVVFVSGDKGLCDEIKEVNENISTLAVKEGIGNSTLSIHNDLAVELTQKKVEQTLSSNFKLCEIKLPDSFEVEISYAKHTKAYKASFYPGMKQISPTNVLFKTKDYFEVLRMISFVV